MSTPRRLTLRPMPDQRAILPLDGTITADDFARICRGWHPRTPADKWIILWHNEKLCFWRSTTGSCIFQLIIRPQDTHYITPELMANRDPAQYRPISDQYDVELLAWLIDHHLLGRNPPFPQPPRLNQSDRQKHRLLITGSSGESDPPTVRLTLFPD
jgi:hypothetical protein